MLGKLLESIVGSVLESAEAMKLGQGKTALVRFHLKDIEEFIQSQRDRARSRATTQGRW